MRLFILLFLVVLVDSCSDSRTIQYNGKEYTFKKEAIKLNDQAVKALKDPDADVDRAIALLARSIRIDSTFFTAYHNKIEFESKSSKYGYGLNTARAFVHQFPNDRAGIMKLGIIEEKNGNTSEAKSLYQQYLQLTNEWVKKNPQRINEAEFDFALAYYLLGDTVKGEDLYIRAKVENPDNEFLQDSKNLRHIVDGMKGTN